MKRHKDVLRLLRKMSAGVWGCMKMYELSTQVGRGAYEGIVVVFCVDLKFRFVLHSE